MIIANYSSAASLALSPAPMLEGYRVFFWAHLLPSQPIRLGQEIICTTWER